MLELILGRAGTGKTTLLRKRLAESTAPKTILIVPEQYTFESERARPRINSSILLPPFSV